MVPLPAASVLSSKNAISQHILILSTVSTYWRKFFFSRKFFFVNIFPLLWHSDNSSYYPRCFVCLEKIHVWDGRLCSQLFFHTTFFNPSTTMKATLSTNVCQEVGCVLNQKQAQNPQINQCKSDTHCMNRRLNGCVRRDAPTFLSIRVSIQTKRAK